MNRFPPMKVNSIAERLLGATVFLLLAFTILFQVTEMAPASLWTDELFSVSVFSSKGPLTALTHYPVPNNHIFFNFLNSLLPQSDAYHPLRARFVSLTALFLTLAVLGIITFKLRKPFVVAPVLAVIASTPYLDLIVQARGYGMLSCIALLQCVLVFRFFTGNNETRNLSALALLSIIGAWTVPSYLFFAGPLHIFLLAARFSWPVFFTGAAAALGIAGAYAPVISQLLESALSFKDVHGAHFTELKALYTLPRTYLLLRSEAWYAVTAVSVIGAAFFFSGGERRAYLVLLSSAVALLVITLQLQTPLARTVVFVLIPFAFLLGLAVERLVQVMPAFAGTLCLLLLLAATSYYSHFRLTNFAFTPIENWTETAAFLEGEFPRTTKIYAPFRQSSLRHYITQDFVWAKQFNEEEFSAGNLVVVENDFKKRVKIVTEENYSNLRTHTIPQRRGGGQRVLWVEH